MNLNNMKSAVNSAVASVKYKVTKVPPTDSYDFNREFVKAYNRSKLGDFLEDTFSALPLDQIEINLQELVNLNIVQPSFFPMMSTFIAYLPYYLSRTDEVALIGMIIKEFYVAKAKNLPNFPEDDLFDFLYKRLPADILEKVVFDNFEVIARNLDVNTVFFLTAFTSWCGLVAGHFDDVMESVMKNLDVLRCFTRAMPEYEIRAYEYLINVFADRKFEYWDFVDKNESKLLDYVLVPFSEVGERYGNSTVLKSRAYDLLDNMKSSQVFYQVADFLITEKLGIPARMINRLIDRKTDRVIELIKQLLNDKNLTIQKVCSEGYMNSWNRMAYEANYLLHKLKYFFNYPRVYYRFLNSLPELFEHCEQSILYALLFKLIGEIPELIKFEPTESSPLEMSMLPEAFRVLDC